MSWRLTPEERRIIERTKREGEELYGQETPAEKRRQPWRSALTLIAIIAAFVLIAALIYYIGTFL